MIAKRLAGESGTSLLELAVTLFITSLMSASLVTWIGTAGTAAGLHSSDDQAVQDLRLAKEHLTRDLRVAQAVLVAESASVSVWIDADGDDFQDAGEEVTWTIADGLLTRAIGLAAPHVEVSNLDGVTSGFTYDSPQSADVTQIEVTLVAFVSAGSAEPSRRTLTVAVHVRNAP